MKTSAWLALVVMLPFLLGSCAGVSGLGAVAPAAAVATKGVSKAAEASREITDSEEYYIGRAVAARILGKYTLSANAKLNDYVNEVGQTVARKSSRPNTFKGYHFAVLDTSEVNAFACPGGLIFVTKGLVQTCDDEDQLAAALAHEVGHVANKDGIKSISQARWTEVFTAMGAEAARQYGGVAGNLVAMFESSIDDVFKTIVVSGYGRAAEEAADKASVTTLSRAGYDSKALAQLLEKMLAKEKGASGGIFTTHPPTSERLAKAKTEAGAGSTRGEQRRAQRFKKEIS